jgi:hypothetical protein
MKSGAKIMEQFEVNQQIAMSRRDEKLREVYDSWKANFPAYEEFELFADLGVCEFDVNECVECNDGRSGMVVGTDIDEDGRRKYRIEFPDPDNLDDESMNECDWYFERELAHA